MSDASVFAQIWALVRIENNRQKRWIKEDAEMAAEESRKAAEFTTELKLKQDGGHTRQ